MKRFLTKGPGLFLTLILTLSPLVAQRPVDSLILLAESMEDSEEKARQFLKIAVAYHGVERDTSQYFFDKSWTLLQKFPAPDIIADAKTTAVEIFRQDWSLDTLVSLLEESMDFYQQENNQDRILVNLINLGAIYSNRSLYEEAIPYCLQALDLAEQIKDTLQQGKIAFNLGVVYYNTSMHNEAAKKFTEAQHYFNSIGNESLAGMALSGVVNVFLNTDQNDSALIYAEQLLEIGDNMNYSRLQLNARSNLGAIYNNLGEYEKAIKYYREAQFYAKRFGSKLSLMNCWCALGTSYTHLGELDSAAHYFEEAYALDAGENEPIMHQFCSKKYAEVLHKRGELKKSNELLQQYVQYQDSILVKENKEVIAGLEKKYQASKKDAEIAEQQLTIEQRTSQRNRYLLGLLLAAGFIGFLFYRYRQNKKLQAEKIQNLEKYQRILAMDSMLQGQEEERKRIAQDLHDGLGTLLAAARMQMQNVQHELDKLGNLKLVDKTEQLIDHACKEVRRISHDMMPSALADLGLIAALEDLVDDVRFQQDLVFNLDLPDVKIDIDNATALNIYRIVQEILQNIIKHAQANIVEMQVEKTSTHLNIRIADDGVGMPETQVASDGIGLQNIRSRTQYLKAEFEIKSKAHEGVAYHIQVPLQAYVVNDASEI